MAVPILSRYQESDMWESPLFTDMGAEHVRSGRGIQ